MKKVASQNGLQAAAAACLLCILGVASTGAVQAQAQPRPDPAFPPCQGLVFSTEEDFLSQGPTPPDGNPIVSDGDLISRNFPVAGVNVCARNRHLLQAFEVRVDLGLDAVDVADAKRFLIAFSTELDDPGGRFTAGDLLATNGAVLPNSALLARFALPVRHDLGLDAVHLVGERDRIARLLQRIRATGRDAWAEAPEKLPRLLEELEVDILFSTSGTGFSPAKPSFLDGDLLSAKTGTIVVANASFLPALPAGLPDRGVDYGLDAFTRGHDPIENIAVNLFSTEIGSLDRPLTFTDGDVLQQGGGVFWKNFALIEGLEPKASDLGLDALDFVAEPDCKIAEITRVGGIQVSLIDSVTGYAQKQDGHSPDPTVFDAPFGRWVSVRGNVPDPHCVEVSQYEYRVEFREGAGPWVPIITHAAWQAAVGFGCASWAPYQSDGAGWIPLSLYWQAEGCATDQALNVWNTAGKDGRFALRLTVRQIGMPGTAITSSTVPVVLDNTAPAPVEMTLYNASGTAPLADQCQIGGTEGDTIITIKGRVRDNGTGGPSDGDEHFRVYQLRWTGGLFHSWDMIDLAPGETPGYRFYDGGRADLDGTGTLPPAATDVPLGKFNLTQEHIAKTGQPPIACGYTIWLRAWDRALLGSFKPAINLVTDVAVQGWRSDYLQSFCFKPAD